MELIGAILSLVVALVALNALLKCAAELRKIREHLDRMSPEVLVAMKTARRNGAATSASA